VRQTSRPIDAALAALAGARHRDPFSVLGPHAEDGAVVVRALNPAARSIELRLVESGEVHPMHGSNRRVCSKLPCRAIAFPTIAST